MSQKVTVLTLVYNGLPYLEYAIDSTLKQTYTDFEYLIIDDASPDQDIEKFVESYNDPRIRFVRNAKNLGVSRTFNKALTMIDSPYIIRLDQDDISLPNRVEEQLSYLEENIEISIVCSWEHTINSKGIIIRDWKKKIKNYGEFIGPVLMGLCPIWHPSIAFRKDDMIKVGGFKSEYARAEDFEVTACFARNKLRAAIVPSFHLLQRHHDNSQSAIFQKEQADMSHIIQKEAIADFIEADDAEKLAFFLRFDRGPSADNFTKNYLIEMHDLLSLMIKNVGKNLSMSSSELFSMKKIIYRRLGCGVYFMPFYKFLPEFLFLPIFFTLSPLFSHSLHKQLSRLNNYLHELKYSTKNFF